MIEEKMIPKSELLVKLRDYAERKHAAGHTELANGILKAVNYIRNEIVGVDAVEVVRRKDCKWWENDECWNVNGAGGYISNGDWFCRSGERKTDNDNQRSKN